MAGKTKIRKAAANGELAPSKVAGEFLNVPEAAELCRVSEWTIRQWLTRGVLPRYKAVGRTLIGKSDVLNLIQPEHKEKV